MSNSIRRYKTINNHFERAKDLELTAFVGGEKFGHCIQFTIGDEYACLSEIQLIDLIETITKRLALKKGFRATDSNKEKIVFPDGTFVEEGEDYD